MRQPFPGRITLVEAQTQVRRHLGVRVNVFIEDKFSFALSAELAFKHGLRPGLDISPTFLTQLLREDGESKALTTALNFLGPRPRAEAEIRTRLARDEWSEAVIEVVLQRLRLAKLVDDGQFAQEWVGARSRSKPRGARALKQELRQKGIAKEEIEAALPDQESEIENAVSALRKTARKWEGVEEKVARQKALEFLVRRGFSFGVSQNAWKQWREEIES